MLVNSGALNDVKYLQFVNMLPLVVLSFGKYADTIPVPMKPSVIPDVNSGKFIDVKLEQPLNQCCPDPLVLRIGALTYFKFLQPLNAELPMLAFSSRSTDDNPLFKNAFDPIDVAYLKSIEGKLMHLSNAYASMAYVLLMSIDERARQP